MKLPLISEVVRGLLVRAKKHKIISGIVALLLIGLSIWGYRAFTTPAAASAYTVGSVARGTIVSTVDASGQVSNVDTIDVKPKASGEVTWVGAKAGQSVRAGQALATIDNTDAKQAVADAEQTLNQARLQYQKDSAQAPIDYASAERSVSDAQTKLATTYDDTFTAISNAYLNLPAVMTGADNALHGFDLSTSKSQWNADVLKAYFVADQTTYTTVGDAVSRAESDYATALSKYNTSLAEYRPLTRYSATSSFETSLSDSTDMAKAVAQALQSELNMFDAASDAASARGMTLNPKVATLRSAVEGYLATANSTFSALSAEQSSLTSAKQTLQSSRDSLAIMAIGNATDGTNPISLQSSAYDLQGKERAVQTAQDALSDYVITAPFSGTLSSVSVNLGDTVSTGTSVASLVSSEQVAKLSLNEVDAAKIKLGDRATLTFDAIDGLSLTGKIASIDTVGTVSQGVVSYTVEISFDTQDARVKSGMTVNASIQTDVAQDALIVPSSAVKTANGESYVLTLNDSSLSDGANVPAASVTVLQTPVVTGISDDTDIEIKSGLSEGQQIVTRSTSVSASAASSGTTRTGSSGATRTGGGTVRFGGPGLF